MAAPLSSKALPLLLAALAGCSGSSPPLTSSGPPSSVQPGLDAGSPPSEEPDASRDGSLPVEDGGIPSEASAPSALSAAGLRIDLQATSVSGLSSGAFMAVQFQVAFSSIIQGAAIFAGGPFDCAQGSVANALTACADPLVAPDVSPLVALTSEWSSAGAIDDVSNLAHQRVFLFGGADDRTVSPVVVDALSSYYSAFLGSQAIVYESRHPDTGHTMPTLDYGAACSLSASPWIGLCSYDGAGKGLEQIYGSLSPPSAAAAGAVLSLSQGHFISDPASHSLADTAYAYVPTSCTSGEVCRLHVAFHGCSQEAAGPVGSAFYSNAGYNTWADTNHLVVVYPQTIASTTNPTNPEACWDWWGYDSPNYAKKTGPQMAMVRAMIDYLATPVGAGG